LDFFRAPGLSRSSLSFMSCSPAGQFTPTRPAALRRSDG